MNMSDHLSDAELARAYYLDFAAALVRHRLPHLDGLSSCALFREGIAAGLRLHHFKRTNTLPRVRKVLGILHGLAPESLLDIGSGRGVFLWPLLDAFPDLHVIAVDRNPLHVSDIHAVHAGGIERVDAVQLDVTRFALMDGAVDVVTFLEVLEHQTAPLDALRHAVRIARRFVVLSVPSQPDDNPEHLHLFTRQSLTAMFAAVGVQRLTFDSVLNHHLVVARVDD
jgi:2-polyprenyl-3-methyl-5-hydroxy-6-metoxy-1,4-benzoquinol methylase